MTTVTPITRITVGTEFRSVVADCNPLWRCTRRVRAGVWEAVVVNEPFVVNGVEYEGDYAGKRGVFTAEHISAVLRQQAAFDRSQARRADFYAGLVPGMVVHYHNGFGQFVRCEVVDVDGQNMLRPFRLVGTWADSFMPRWDPERREIRFSTAGHFLDIGSTGFEPWQPTDTCVWESPSFSDRGRYPQDPDTLVPIDPYRFIPKEHRP